MFRDGVSLMDIESCVEDMKDFLKKYVDESNNGESQAQRGQSRDLNGPK